ncbi:hypothetical protein [Haloplanus halophilus]|uniref:hypothetical protein n=1 Tax=Haloplanus halophilus TaxID=2949993 RepID=UPI00203C7D30|nr:hypothetical protein [Haloplanus sp. GDY1]
MAGDPRGLAAALGSAGSRLIASLRWLLARLLAPLRTGDGPNKFRLSSVETHTTTIDGDTGWPYRPPATLRCPECGSGILQPDSREDIDCPTCSVTLPPERFTDLELLALTCPICRTRMQHGRRHPETFEVPEWATCHNCQYHWEFKHFY